MEKFTRIVILGAALLGETFEVHAQTSEFSEINSIWKKIQIPNVVHLYDSFFIDETEMSNIHYLEYLHDIREDSSYSFHQSQLPDSSSWQVGLQPKDTVDMFVYYYFRYPGFRYYPVVGVSYEQAMNFCKWRGNVVTELIRFGGEHYKRPHFLDGYDVTVEYRLPTKEEWERAAYGRLDRMQYPYGLKRPLEDKYYSFKIKNDLCSKCLEEQNFTYSRNDVIHKVEFNVLDDYYFSLDSSTIICKDDNSLGLRYIYDFPPNTTGLFNVIGNVSEMTLTKGLAKGGSFRNKLSEFTINTDFSYTDPSEILGFRCVAVLHLKREPVSTQTEKK